MQSFAIPSQSFPIVLLFTLHYIRVYVCCSNLTVSFVHTHVHTRTHNYFNPLHYSVGCELGKKRQVLSNRQTLIHEPKIVLIINFYGFSAHELQFLIYHQYYKKFETLNS